MATYNRPGVYINELPLAAAPINGALAAQAAGAVIAAFPQGPDTVTRVTSWYDFTKKFGGYSPKYPATYSVGSFFKNGGTELYVQRVLPAMAKKVAKAAIPTIGDQETRTITAVYVPEVGESGKGNVAEFTTSAAHGLSTGDKFVVSGLTPPQLNTPPGALYTATTISGTVVQATLASSIDVIAEDTAATGTVSYYPEGNAYLNIAAKHRGIDGNNIRVMISESKSVRQSGYYDIVVYYEAGTSDYVDGEFTPANAADDVVVEQFTGVIFNDPLSSDYAPNVLEFGSSYITILEGPVTEYDDEGDTVSPVVTYTVSVPSPSALNTVYPLSGAPDPEVSLTYGDYTGNYFVDGSPDSGYNPAGGEGTTGTFNVDDCLLFSNFESIDRPLVFFLPDVIAKIAPTFDGDPAGWSLAKFVYNALIDWVEAPKNNGRHFVVVETASGLSADGALDASGDLSPESSRAAVYYPHIYIKDPAGRSSGSVRRIGPSGAVVGLYMNTDRLVGPFKTPAGIDSRVTDAVAIERAFSPSELDALNTGVTTTGVTAGINVVNAIRNVPGAGVVIMGGRTLKQDGTANRYVNMRRSLTYLQKRLNDLASFAVFENNTEKLWARLTTTIGTFLNEYRNQGGLRGTTIEQSYYVKCDAENNTAASIQAGEVHIEVGVALEYPAEFVVINLSQKTAE